MEVADQDRFHLQKQRLAISLILWLMVLPAWADSGARDQAPPWKMRDSGGEVLHFPEGIDADLSLVLFWASWCAYCKALMPRLLALQQELGTERLPVLAMRLEVQAEDDLNSSSAPAGFRVFEQAWDVAEDYGVSVLPGLFLVREGRIVYRLDYPPADHPSQQMKHGAAQAALLGQWWEQRLRDLLREEELTADSG